MPSDPSIHTQATLVSLVHVEGRTDSLLLPGMDNTRHFYSITAVAGTV